MWVIATWIVIGLVVLTLGLENAICELKAHYLRHKARRFVKEANGWRGRRHGELLTQARQCEEKAKLWLA